MPLIQARAGFRQRRGLRVEVDVVGDEEVELAVLVVIDKRAAGIPAPQPVPVVGGDPGFRARRR